MRMRMRMCMCVSNWHHKVQPCMANEMHGVLLAAQSIPLPAAC